MVKKYNCALYYIIASTNRQFASPDHLPHAMARANRTPSGKHSSAKPRPSASKANAAGYEKRQSRKAKALHALQPSDVYEYASEKNRRSNVALDLDRDEAAEFGGGMGDEEREELRARLIGEHDGDDGALDSGDDEEIDSDAAFEESDEDRFAGFFSTRVRFLSFPQLLAEHIGR